MTLLRVVLRAVLPSWPPSMSKSRLWIVATQLAAAARDAEGQRNPGDTGIPGGRQRVGLIGVAAKTPGVEVGRDFGRVRRGRSHQGGTRQQVSRFEFPLTRHVTSTVKAHEVRKGAYSIRTVDSRQCV